MPRTFNTTGPCEPANHYMLPAEARLPDLRALVVEGLYFGLHAPRQSGKTTAMRAFASRLRTLGFAAVWASLERSQGIEEIAQAEPLWIRSIVDRALVLPPADRAPDPSAVLAQEPGQRLFAFLRAWSAQCARPLVLLLDEADVLSGPALVSFLRQLRDGFVGRGPGQFPVSIGLIGMRDLRDYVITAKGGRQLNPGSPFNIKSESITLRNFGPEEVRDLLQQHTDDTGQAFTPAAAEAIHEQTGGQPFLVNALARRCVASTTAAIDVPAVWAAREALVLARTTHLDALAHRLQEPRVARIIAAVVGGLPDFEVDLGSDDLLYCVDLGLLRRHPRIEVSNPIYREVLARVLSDLLPPTMPELAWAKGGRLDLGLLIHSFLTFWQRHADALRRKDIGGYQEIVPHLVFMAWLQRVVNGGGRIHREYALGRGRLDLLVEYGGETHAIELKRVGPHDGLDITLEEGMEQLAGYLDHLGLAEGWLLIFDERPGRSWAERRWEREVEVAGRRVHLRGA